MVLIYSSGMLAAYSLALGLIECRFPRKCSQAIKKLTVASGLIAYIFLQYFWMKIQRDKIKNSKNEEEPIFNTSLYSVTMFSFTQFVQPFILEKWYSRTKLFFLYQLAFLVNCLILKVEPYFIFQIFLQTFSIFVIYYLTEKSKKSLVYSIFTSK